MRNAPVPRRAGSQGEKLRELRRRARGSTVTLVHGAPDTEHNGAVVLAKLVRSR